MGSIGPLLTCQQIHSKNPCQGLTFSEMSREPLQESMSRLEISEMLTCQKLKCQALTYQEFFINLSCGMCRSCLTCHRNFVLNEDLVFQCCVYTMDKWFASVFHCNGLLTPSHSRQSSQSQHHPIMFCLNTLCCHLLPSSPRPGW